MTEPKRMKTILILHESDEIDREILVPWLASFSDLAGVIVLREKTARMRTRVKREIKRVGYARFIDVLAFRLYYRLFLAGRDEAWRRQTIESFSARFPAIGEVDTLITHSPNSPEAEQFLRNHSADIIVARCKTLLKKNIFSLARTGTVVFHPGICPEYRNAHGCFWALAEKDFGKVGMTLLKIDEGIDTGPTYGYYSYDFDPLHESHIVIQYRVVLENLAALRSKLEEIHAGTAAVTDVRDRNSGVWGQPWLTKYLSIQKDARAKAAFSARENEVSSNG